MQAQLGLFQNDDGRGRVGCAGEALGEVSAIRTSTSALVVPWKEDSTVSASPRSHNKLQAICTLDPAELESVGPPRGYVDAGYSGACAARIQQQHRIEVEVVRHPANRNVGRWVSPDQGELFAVQADSKGFLVLPKRWIVERSHAWYERCRRLIMHHHRLLSVSAAWVWLAGARMLVRRFATAIRAPVYPRCVMSIPPHCRSRYSATSRRWQ